MTEEFTVPQNLNNKTGIHWVGNAVWAQTGYGTQAKLLLPRFVKLGYGVTMTAYYGLQGHVLNFNGLNIFPCGYHPYGMDVCAANANISGAKILMTCIDLWVCEPQMFQGPHWVPWYPIDSGTVSTLIKTKIASAFDMISMSKFGQKMVEELGYKPRYAPCSFDPEVFKPMDRIAALNDVNQHIQFKIPKDVFVVSMVQMNKGNPSRKAFYEQFKAFKTLHNKHSDTALYCHSITSQAGEQAGINLIEMCKYIGLEPGKDVLFPDPLSILNGYPDIYLNAVYNASDVLSAVTMGEGFGIPIIEAQGAGCPVIVGDWTSMSELHCSGWKVDKSEASEFWTVLGAIQYLPKWEAIADRLESAYQMRGNQDYRDRAHDGAKAWEVDRVVEKYWKPALEEINARIQEYPVYTEPVK
jgi:glycosyltransferase involved in cell wall biosynthesis